jgi:hypothetical protein
MDLPRHDVSDELLQLVMAHSSSKALSEEFARQALSFLTPAEQLVARLQLQGYAAPSFDDVNDFVKWVMSLSGTVGVIGQGPDLHNLVTYRRSYIDDVVLTDHRSYIDDLVLTDHRSYIDDLVLTDHASYVDDVLRTRSRHVSSAPTRPRVTVPYIYTLIGGTVGAAAGWDGFLGVPNDPLALLLLMAGALVGAYIDCAETD